MSVFVHAHDIKTFHAGGWVKKWQNSVHAVVECPLSIGFLQIQFISLDFSLELPLNNILIEPYSFIIEEMRNY